MSGWRSNRDDFGWHYGYVGKRWWCSVARSRREAIFLDVGPWRIRWASPNFRPLFSERYGHQKWHKVGRLAANYTRRSAK